MEIAVANYYATSLMNINNLKFVRNQDYIPYLPYGMNFGANRRQFKTTWSVILFAER